MKKNLSPEALAREAQRQRLARVKTARRPRTTSPRLSTSQKIGFAKENQAAAFLEQQGLVILEKNTHSMYGEIDIVARSFTTLVFIEVRYRHDAYYGGARSSVSLAKQQRIKRLAQQLLPQWTHLYFDGHTPFCRFDVVAFEGNTLHWIQDAFR
ncbi:YraN family protein [Paenalcaligenes hominis]|uniref:YraN family protein n=1 Tax=Paenalcaligenes hominis TaxID=643674 RepID=UPI003525D897